MMGGCTKLAEHCEFKSYDRGAQSTIARNDVDEGGEIEREEC